MLLKSLRWPEVQNFADELVNIRFVGSIYKRMSCNLYFKQRARFMVALSKRIERDKDNGAMIIQTSTKMRGFPSSRITRCHRNNNNFTALCVCREKLRCERNLYILAQSALSEDPSAIDLLSWCSCRMTSLSPKRAAAPTRLETRHHFYRQSKLTAQNLRKMN